MLALSLNSAAISLASIPALLVILPLALCIAAFTRLLHVKHQLIVGVPLITLGGLLALTPLEGALAWSLGGWDVPIGIRWQLTPTSLALLCLTSVVAGISSVTAYAERTQQREYWALWWLLWAALNTLWLTRDTFNVYVALELLTLSAAGLIALSPKDPYGFSALRYLFVALVASLLYLLGVGLLYGAHGTLDIDLLSERSTADVLHACAALCITLGLMMKAALVPLHSWLPQAHSRAAPPVSAMLSAVVVAVALYWLWQFWQGPFQALAMEPLFAFLGGISLLWGGINALQQTQLKRLIAYSTVSQMGYALLILSLSPDIDAYSQAQQGATALLVAHGLAKAGLFLTAGILVVYHRSGHLQALSGSAYRYPWLWAGLALSAASLVGLPPSGGFVGKWWLFIGLWEQQRWLTASAFLLGTLLTAAYLARLFSIGLRPTAAVPASPPCMPHTLAALNAILLGGLAWSVGVVLLIQQGYFSLPRLDRTSSFFALPALFIWPLVLAWQHRQPSPPSRFFTQLLWLSALCHAVALTAQEWLTFYSALAWLGILGWLLILHGTNRTAAQIYLAMMLLAEVLLFAATAHLAQQGTLNFSDTHFSALLTSTALLIGGGLMIKAGVLGVHGWLPIAHPAAPALASALLSGVMIKLGILGLLRLTPESADSLPAGQLLIYWGLAGALYAGVRACLSTLPKAALAWSSVGQIGLLTAGIGALLWMPENDALRTTLMLLVISHGLAKAALFIGAGEWRYLASQQRWWVSIGMVAAALTLIGAPFSGGLYIKSWLTYALSHHPHTGGLLTLASVATAAAMLRFGWLLWCQQTSSRSAESDNRWRWRGWGWLCAGAWLIPWIWQVGLPYPGSWLAANTKALVVIVVTTAVAAGVVLVFKHIKLTTVISTPWQRTSFALLAWHHASRIRLAWKVERRLRHWPAIAVCLFATSCVFVFRLATG